MVDGCFAFLRSKGRRGERMAAEALVSRADTHRLACACGSFEPLPSYSRSVKSAPQAPYSGSSEKVEGLLSDVSKTIESKIQDLSSELRDLSLKMWDLKEIQWQEHKTHDLFVEYFKKQSGWTVTPHAYDIDTAFKVEFSHRAKSTSKSSALPTIGFQSELDALPGIGHACGHNLISISGVAASLSVAQALVEHDIDGRVILLGTPAEEGGGGKLSLITAGAYKEMDACLMIHPAPLSSVGAMIAVIQINVTYTGHTAHAGAAPWQGVNAQDAGVLAYMNISALRQQIQTTHRVHGIIQGKDWAANVIPASCELIYNLRAPTVAELEALIPRVVNCFEAAGTATGCKVDVKRFPLYKNVVNNPAMASSYQSFMEKSYNDHVGDDTFFASTDFGNVTFELPALHAEYAIKLKDPLTDGNHTIGFADAAKTMEAHKATLKAATGIAATGAKVLVDEEYRKHTYKQWKEWKDATV